MYIYKRVFFTLASGVYIGFKRLPAKSKVLIGVNVIVVEIGLIMQSIIFTINYDAIILDVGATRYATAPTPQFACERLSDTPGTGNCLGPSGSLRVCGPGKVATGPPPRFYRSRRLRRAAHE